MSEELLRWKNINFNKLFAYENKILQKNKHDITDEEWNQCKEYFNYKCAYCGLSEKDSKELYNKVLLKEHVENHGSDHIDNCVPACVRCNTSKGSKNFEEWYKNNINYTKERYNRIVEWLNLHNN